MPSSSALTQLPQEEVAINGPTNPYPELRALIKEQGLLRNQPLYYSFKIPLTLAIFGLALALMFVLENFWLQLLNAAFLAFAFCQVGFVGHDAGHRGIFGSIRKNEIVSLSVNFLIGLSRSWWMTQHNRHHTDPNYPEADPHIAIPLLAFTQDIARSKQGILRLFVGYQAFYYVPMLLLEGIGIRIASAQFLLSRRKAKYLILEPLLLGLHIAVYLGLVFYLLSPWHAAAFILVHQALFGLYYGLVFAPNHKGMMILDKTNSLDYMRRQVFTTRNVRPNPFVDFWYGGLNYQIEHHLFPMMPRNNLGKARKIIKEFCHERGIPYHEATTPESLREVLTYLHWAGAPLRSRSANLATRQGL